MKNLLRNLAYSSVLVAAISFTVIQFTRPAQAQSGSQIAAATFHNSGDCQADGAVLLTNGDVYHIVVGTCGFPPTTTLVGNIWGGSPIAVEPSTWSGIKTKLGTPSEN